MNTTKNEQIQAILDASRTPMLEVAKCIEYECTDGLWRGVLSMHSGHKMTGKERVAGYCLISKDGVRIGVRYPSEKHCIDEQIRKRDASSEEFRAQLEAMDDAAFARQVAYWLKPKA